MTMRRVLVTADGIGLEEAEVPVPAEHEVLVRGLVAGVCGSDTHAAHGRHPFVALPYHPGHEAVGVVEALGAGVTSVRVGDRVTVEPDLPCWHCKMCVTGRENLCENLQFFGCGWPQGGMGERWTIAANRLHVVPGDLSLAAAALIEPLSTPVHAVRVAGDVAGKAVAVLGAGTIGLLVLRVLKALGAHRIVVTDPLPAKRGLALRLGADAVVDATAADAAEQVRRELGESADVVFDCVAVEPTVRQAISIADKGGTVVIVGVPAREVTVPLPIIQDHQIRVQGSATYLPEDYRDAVRLLQAGAVRPEDFVTAVYPMEEAAAAFDASSSGAQVKVLVSITAEATAQLAP
ncbi:zinc-binding dehydrogenase [Spongisporangium articulatum]|uniref:Zinc-binding dehydrogenase n=1 Tax=Spongisporangium articulatum TaxID=3362603 RepID=A0ABW8AGS9_9ACTN